jgi:predicted RNase H-like HicB family nuclease
MRFAVVIHKDQNSDYGVIVPDMPGCFSAGTTIEEALNMAKDAILCHVEGLLMDDEKIPQPSPIEKYWDNPEFEGGKFMLIEINSSEISGKIARINVTIPERILAKVDKYVARNGGNRSALMTDAIVELMSKQEHYSAYSGTELGV